MKTPVKTPYDYLAVIDFEATCEENNPGFRHEIIEFPVVLVDVEKMEIVSKSYTINCQFISVSIHVTVVFFN